MHETINTITKESVLIAKFPSPSFAMIRLLLLVP